ncbi:MAG: hypothetical protein RLZZ262_793 [Bacteroidota bacterium]|jgi:hypothetical protein
MNVGASVAGILTIGLKLTSIYMSIQDLFGKHHESIEARAQSATAGAGGNGTPSWTNSSGYLVSGNGDNVETLIDYLASQGYTINRDPKDWNNGNPSKSGLHIYDVYNVLKSYGYADKNLTEGEVSIPLDAIEKLVVKRAVKAHFSSTPLEIKYIWNREGQVVMLPSESFWDHYEDIFCGGREWVGPEGTLYKVDSDGQIEGIAPIIGYPPDFGSGGVRVTYNLLSNIAKNARRMSLDEIGDFLKAGKDWHKTNAKTQFLNQFKKELKGDTNADFYIDKVTKEVFLKSNKSGNWINTGQRLE